MGEALDLVRRLMTKTDVRAGVPIRTCVGCGKKGTRRELLRLIQVAGSAIAVDRKKSLPGRGAWLHPVAECLTRTRKNRRITRALRLTEGASWEAVEDFFAAHGLGNNPHNDESGLEADGHPMSTQR